MSDTPAQMKRHELAERWRKGNDFVEGMIARLKATKQECANRYAEIDHPQVVPIHHFTEASTECIFLYAAGHFYSTIMVAQAVAEGISRFVAEREGIDFNRKNTIGPDIVDLLIERGIVSKEYKDAFDRLWETRNDVHHMNPEVAAIRIPDCAKGSMQDLVAIQGEIFSFNVSNGTIVPFTPKYWGTQ